MGGSRARGKKTETARREREEREAAAKGRKEDVDNRSLYICTAARYHFHSRYHVHAIKVSDLFSFSQEPIIMSPSMYDFKSKSTCNPHHSKLKLREVASIGGPNVATDMGFGVFRSQIALVGGRSVIDRFCIEQPLRSYVLETSALKGSKFRWGVIPSMKLEREDPSHPCLLEVNGKLYAISVSCFVEFDPEANVWTHLKPFPDPYACPNYFALGSKIFAIDMNYGTAGVTHWFDVTTSTNGVWTKHDSLLYFEGSSYEYCKLLVVDSEEDKFEKLLFTYDRKIFVHRILLSEKGEPKGIELITSTDLPKLPDCTGLRGFVPYSYCCTYLGDRKVCFSFSSYVAEQPLFKPVVLFTLEFAYSKSGATSSSDIISSSNPSSSSCGSFVFKFLGSRFFRYKYPEQHEVIHGLVLTRLGGLFVL